MSTVKIKTSWDEVTLEEYMKISEIELDEELKINPISKSLKFISILSDKNENEIFEMDQVMFSELLEKISFIMISEPVKRDGIFKINGVDYMFHPDFDKLTTGEIISIQTICNDAVKEDRSFLPEILSMLIRPCSKRFDEERKEDIFEIEKFKLENLEHRRKLFLKELKVPYFVKHLDAFMDGANRSKIISNLSSVRKNHLEGQIKELKGIIEKNH